ncbi:GNAT family N-acetyltransferase [Roseobacter sp. YSTF-M11]|uniref:GNAT family N-acetyltransferase n=1 Tax=Roseobacter insulae TaxID=2859783 RepID=A0A9X1FWM6_9RHOB|nr:GNAT family N-acetyltransferase [Roseobacter insulae]MBW4708997.1 GNAT family N-acetyltransferase [Roseobacter insulae]
MQTGIQIDAGTQRDFGSCGELARACPPLVEHEPFAYWSFLAGFPNGTLLARHEGRDIGFLCSFETPNAAIGRFVWQIGVLEAYRRSGVAMMLLDSLRNHFPQEPLMSACIDPDNTPSMSLFNRFAERYGGTMHRNEAFTGELANTPVDEYGEDFFALEFQT